MEISGLERHLALVMRLGISTLRQLATADAEELHRRLVNAIGLGGAPSLSDVQYWISQARCIDVVDDPEETTKTRLRRYVPSYLKPAFPRGMMGGKAFSTGF